MIKRIVSASILIPLVVYLVLKADLFYVRLSLFAVEVLAFFEWLSLDGKSFGLKKGAYLLLSAILSLVFLFYSGFFVYALFSVFVISMVISFGSLKEGEVFNDYFYFSGILYVMLYSFGEKLMGFDNGRWLLLLLFVSIWAGDSVAYFCGRSLGRNKLAPTISPKKTVEGALCGVVGGILAGLLFGFAFSVDLYDALLISVVSNITGILGDLAESVVKRFFSRKDSSNLIPGHGGILDRLDSFAFAAFFSYLVIQCKTLLF